MSDLAPLFQQPPDEPAKRWDPSAPGRGPGRFKDWYMVNMADGTDFKGLYVEVDFSDPVKANHVLTFELEGGATRRVLYGEIVDCLPINETRRQYVISARRKKGTRI